MNRVFLQGNVGRAPRIVRLQDGREVIDFYVATKTSWKDEGGEWQTHTDWHRITVFRESTVKWLKDILKKGDAVYIEGKLTYHSWTDTYNQPRINPHVVITERSGKIEHIRRSQASVETAAKGENPMAKDQDNFSLSPPLFEAPEETPSRTLECHTLESVKLESVVLEKAALEDSDIPFFETKEALQ